MFAYSDLASLRPAQPPLIVSTPSESDLAVHKANKQALRDSHPSIKFWTVSDYNVYKRSAKRRNTEPADEDSNAEDEDSDDDTTLNTSGSTRSNKTTAIDYIEFENGDLVDVATSDDIRNHARRIFIDMKNGVQNMTLPDTWTEAGVEQVEFFLKRIYKEFPFVSHCMGNWKGNRLGSRLLSSFQATKKRREQREVKKSRKLLDMVDAQGMSTVDGNLKYQH